MRRFAIGLFAILVLFTRSVEAENPCLGWSWCYPNLFRVTYRTLVGAFSRRVTESLKAARLFAPQADGGGDGGDGGDGGGSGDGGGGDSGGDAGGDGGEGEGNGGDTGAVGDQGDQGDQSDATATAQSDPSNDSLTDPAAVAIDDPAQSLRGPGSPGNGGDVTRAAIGPLESPGTTVSIIGVDVTINAIMVSGASTPWDAIGKTAGVRTVIVNGGIIALGENPTAMPPSGGTVPPVNGPPSWLRFKPDLRYLNGSMFPPVVPNVIDIRTMSFSEEVIRNAD